MSAPSDPTDDDLLALALAAAGEAGAALADRFATRRIGDTHYKGPKSLVTDADTEAEAIVVGRIREAFPDHAIVAEEGSEGARATSAPFVWYVDPLDGTTNFAHNIPHFAVSIGVSDSRTNEMAAAVVYDPLLDEVYSATRTGVAMRNGQEIRVSETVSIELSILATGFALRRYSKDMERPMEVFGKVFRAAEDVRRLAAATLDFAYVAAGRLDGFWEEGLSPWDVAAGMLLVERAGGRVSPLRAGEDVLKTGAVVATNAKLHDAVLSLVRG